MNERQRIVANNLPLDKFVYLAAEGYPDIELIEADGTTSDWESWILALPAYSGGEVAVSRPIGPITSPDPDTGETRYSFTLVVVFSGSLANKNLPQLKFVAGEHQRLSVNGDSTGSLNGAAISAGQNEVTIQSNLRARGGAWVNVVSRGAIV